MFKKILSLILVGAMVLSLCACGGNDNNQKSTILTSSNINNYVDIDVEPDGDIRINIICKSKNSLFKFQDVSIEVETYKVVPGDHVERKMTEVKSIKLDENGNGTIKNINTINGMLNKLRNKGDYYKTVVTSASGKVIE